MRAFVVDTNVGVVANGGARQADLACEEASIAALQEVQESGVVVLDDGDLILGEYRRRLRHPGQPGPGYRFLLWLLSNQYVHDHCQRVPLTPIADELREFEEFPLDSAFVGFDRADRKWVAVARASQHGPVILWAVERGWHKYREYLARHGVRTECLCPHLERKPKRKRRV
jgi:hypothetical protein